MADWNSQGRPRLTTSLLTARAQSCYNAFFSKPAIIFEIAESENKGVSGQKEDGFPSFPCFFCISLPEARSPSPPSPSRFFTWNKYDIKMDHRSPNSPFFALVRNGKLAHILVKMVLGKNHVSRISSIDTCFARCIKSKNNMRYASWKCILEAGRAQVAGNAPWLPFTSLEIYQAIKRRKWESWSISCYLCPAHFQDAFSWSILFLLLIQAPPPLFLLEKTFAYYLLQGILHNTYIGKTKSYCPI